jgi:hypothetical protein
MRPIFFNRRNLPQVISKCDLNIKKYLHTHQIALSLLQDFICTVRHQMGGRRRPSTHQVTVVRRAAKALAKETNRPVTGGRFFPDGSFELFVGAPAAAPSDDLDRELADFEAKHGQGAA